MKVKVKVVREREGRADREREVMRADERRGADV
jgi:hypothetical protein